MKCGVLKRVKTDYPWMIYGATGRSGELIAQKAVANGMRPVLAGRDAKAVQKLAETLNLSWRSFDLGDWGKFRREISSVKLLVNAAGPLMQNSVLLAESCLASYTHYFDLSNQIPSLVAMYTLDAEAKERNLTLLPGLALSPAASNCLIKHLHTLLPDADSIEIALEPYMRTHCAGSNLTIVENFTESGFRRRSGMLERCEFGNALTKAVLPTGTRRMLRSALGDVEAAYRSTNVPNITTYIVIDIPPAPDGAERGQTMPRVRSLVDGLPVNDGNHLNPNHHDGRQTLVWARISKTGESSLEGWLQVGEVHDFTASLVVAGVAELIEKKRLSTGAHTPETAFGADFILGLPNVKRTIGPLQQNKDMVLRQLN